MNLKSAFVLRWTALAALLFTVSLPALGMTQAEVDQRIRKYTAKFETMQSKIDKRIPASQLNKAHGIIMLDRTKAGFIFAYQGGSGIAMVRDPKTRAWGPPAFFTATEASLGFQVGGQQSFVVVLLMTTNALRMLVEENVEFGGEATGTALRTSATADATVSTLELEPMIITYTDREGLYGGAALKGNALTPDSKAILGYYEDYLVPSEILRNRKLKTTEAYQALVKKIDSASKPK